MRHWLNKITQNKDFLNNGDTRMVCCELSEQCSKNRIGYREFISSLEWEVIENKKQSFEQIDIDKQKIIIKKLIQALDSPSLWLYESFTEKDLDELILLKLKSSLAQSLENMREYFDRFYEMAITHFADELQDAMEAIHTEYYQDYFKDRATDYAIDDELYHLAYGEYQ